MRAGPAKGMRLETLTLDQLLDVGTDIDERDTASLSLLVRYLDSVYPGWQDGPRGDSRRTASRPAAVVAHSPERLNALKLLGLGVGATAADICAAHRRLIRSVHPDVGGSTTLTAEINAARAILLSDPVEKRSM